MSIEEWQLKLHTLQQMLLQAKETTGSFSFTYLFLLDVPVSTYFFYQDNFASTVSVPTPLMYGTGTSTVPSKPLISQGYRTK